MLDSVTKWKTNVTETDKKLIAAFGKTTDGEWVYDDTINSTLEKTENGVKYTYVMTPQQYTKFYQDTLKEIENGRADLLKDPLFTTASDKDKTDILKSVDKKSAKKVRDEYKAKLYDKFVEKKN